MRLGADVAEHGAAVVLVEGPSFARLALDGHRLFAARERAIAPLAQVFTRAHVFGDEIHVVGVREGIRPAHVLRAPGSEPRTARDGDAAQVRAVREIQIGGVEQRREFTDLHVKLAHQQRPAAAGTLRRDGEGIRTGLRRAAGCRLEKRERFRDSKLLQRVEVDAARLRAEQAIEHALRRAPRCQLGDHELGRHGHAGQPEIADETIDLEHPLGAERRPRHAQQAQQERVTSSAHPGVEAVRIGAQQGLAFGHALRHLLLQIPTQAQRARAVIDQARDRDVTEHAHQLTARGEPGERDLHQPIARVQEPQSVRALAHVTRLNRGVAPRVTREGDGALGTRDALARQRSAPE